MKKVTMPGARPPGGMGAMGQRRLRSAAMIGRMAREGMPSTGTYPMGLGRGKPGAAKPTAQQAAAKPTPTTPKKSWQDKFSEFGRMAREGMNSPAVMPSRAPLKPAQSRGAPGIPGYSSTPNYKQEGAARVNAMSPMDRLSQNAPKFKG